jgi:hypothetical protein
VLLSDGVQQNLTRVICFLPELISDGSSVAVFVAFVAIPITIGAILKYDGPGQITISSIEKATSADQ